MSLVARQNLQVVFIQYAQPSLEKVMHHVLQVPTDMVMKRKQWIVMLSVVYLSNPMQPRNQELF